MSLLQRVDRALDLTMWLLCTLSLTACAYFAIVAAVGERRRRRAEDPKHWGRGVEHRPDYFAPLRIVQTEDTEDGR